MTELERSGFSELDRLLALVRHTRELLDAAAVRRPLPAVDTDYLAETTLPHLEDVQTGFQGSLRSEMAGVEELRFLLAQVAAFRVEEPATPGERRASRAEAAAEERAWARLDDTARRPMRIERARSWPLAALTHARVVLATIPRLPEPAVRFPAGRRTYADIPAPRGPAELADRIAELETSLWRIVQDRAAETADPAFRRTYGFFDTADQLGLRGFRGAA